MKKLAFGVNVPTDPKLRNQWVEDCLRKIERATFDGAEQIADGYMLTNFTESRTLDATAPTAKQVADVLCTFINDLHKRGSSRTQ